jgi:2-methylisocitrate lyase-like PEP mutase family enzyme
MTATQQEKGHAFEALHTSGTFVIPNFWDCGSAVMLERLGFQALASTSAGFAQAIGKLDGRVTLDEKLTHLASVAACTNAPVSADFENGFADQPDAVAANLMRAAQTGIVGASIEDWSGTTLYDFDHAVERIAACVEAATQLDFPFTLTARAENLLRGVNDLDDTIRRLQAFEAAGANVLYAPGLSSLEQVQAVLDAVSKPVNVLFAFMPDKSFSDYETIGVRRISLGGALANHAIGATLSAARMMLEGGDFSWVMQAAPGKVIKQLLD